MSRTESSPSGMLQIVIDDKLNTFLAKGSVYESFSWSAFSGQNHSLNCVLVLQIWH